MANLKAMHSISEESVTPLYCFINTCELQSISRLQRKKIHMAFQKLGEIHQIINVKMLLATKYIQRCSANMKSVLFQGLSTDH